MEIPGEGGAFDLPHVPNAVVADVPFLEVDQPELVRAAGVAQTGLNLLDVEGAERAGEILEELLDHLLLLRVEIGDRDAGVGELVSLELDRPRAVGVGFGDERLGFLLVVERLVDLVGLNALIPPDVVGVFGVLVVAVRGMTVEDRAAEGDAFDAIAVGAGCRVDR